MVRVTASLTLGEHAERRALATRGQVSLMWMIRQAIAEFLDIGSSYNQGQPTRSLYHFKLLIALCEDVGFNLAQECFWFNPAKLPAPAEWVIGWQAGVRGYWCSE
jgi:hypothetical protein